LNSLDKNVDILKVENKTEITSPENIIFLNIVKILKLVLKGAARVSIMDSYFIVRFSVR